VRVTTQPLVSTGENGPRVRARLHSLRKNSLMRMFRVRARLQSCQQANIFDLRADFSPRARQRLWVEAPGFSPVTCRRNESGFSPGLYVPATSYLLVVILLSSRARRGGRGICFSLPAGTAYLSPAFQRWEHAQIPPESRQGRHMFSRAHFSCPQIQFCGGKEVSYSHWGEPRSGEAGCDPASIFAGLQICSNHTPL